MRRWGAVLGVLLFLAGGCDTVPTDRTGEVRDSAGVRIVVAEPLPDGEGALVATRLLSLGDAAGDPAHLFDRIRSVERLDDGAIVVADGGSSEIRIFAADGTPTRRIGGPGQGPGEFTYLRSVMALGPDTLLAYDGAVRRVTAFDRSGALLHDETVPEGLGHALLGVAPDGSWIFFNPATLIPEGPEGTHRSPRSYVAYRRRALSDPGRIDTLLTVPGYEYRTTWMEQNEAWGALQLPFPRNAFAVATGDGMWVGVNDRFRVDRYDWDGGMDFSLRYPAVEQTLTPDVVSELEAATIRQLDPSPARRSSLESLFRDVQHPERVPAFGFIEAVPDGGVWVGGWRSDFAGAGGGVRPWWRFGPDGALLGSVDLPASFHLHDAGMEWLLGVDTDELGIERVVMWGIGIS